MCQKLNDSIPNKSVATTREYSIDLLKSITTFMVVMLRL